MTFLGKLTDFGGLPFSKISLKWPVLILDTFLFTLKCGVTSDQCFIHKLTSGHIEKSDSEAQWVIAVVFVADMFLELRSFPCTENGHLSSTYSEP